MSQPALSSPLHVMDNTNADELKKANVKLQRQVDDLQLDLQKAKNESKRALQALANLRDQLGPLFRALRMVFGEIESVDLPETGTVAASSAGTSSGLSAKWEMLKNKLGGRQAEFIDLLQHGEMTASQLSAAAHCDIRTAYSVIEKMKNGGWLSKNGNKFSLKE